MADRKSKPKKFRKRGQETSSSSSSSSESTSSLSSDDESNARDLKPMKDYLGDRRELARQLFLAVKGDKFRMMLPQVLKKMELKELEEWCANELSGMSKARILSILNGQPMLQSSDSNDTDDSGPSLEIISDTEEWGDVSDLETLSREEESASKKTSESRKDKTRSKQLRGVEKGAKDPDKSRSKSLMKGKVKSEGEPKAQKSSDLVKVKKEAEGNEQQAKEKDGESLLDLLELEMRARAIRALIRKEEDIIPTNPVHGAAAQSSAPNPSSKPSSTAVANNTKDRTRDRQLSLKVVQDKLQELDSNFNRNVGKNSQEISEEEDVVLVLAPTTTIELISSESEDEEGQGKRRNQKLENERIPEKNKAPEVQEAENKQADKEKRRSLEEGEIEAEGETVASENSSNLAKNLIQETEKVGEEAPKKVSTDLEKFRMFKRKTQMKEIEGNEKEKTGDADSPNCGEKKVAEASGSQKDCGEVVSDDKKEDSSPTGKPDVQKEEKNETQESLEGVKAPLKEIEKKTEQQDIEEDKSTDLEIVIDLDDYPDDMEDLETAEKERPGKPNRNLNPGEKKLEVGREESAKSTEDQTAETWATRYYQTDDVQSVIKESKIQSEIRKRLRERQRLARLNNSPNLNPAQNLTPGTVASGEKVGGEKEDSPTMGSVEEYLALKNVEAVLPAGGDEAGERKEIGKKLDVEKVAVREENPTEKNEGKSDAESKENVANKT